MTGFREKKLDEILPATLLGKFLAVLLPVAFLVIGVGLGVSTWLIWQSETGELTSNVEATATSFAGALSVPVWTYETSAQTSILESILQNPNIVSAEITSGRDSLTQHSLTTATGPDNISIIRKVYAPFDSDREIGTFIVTYTRDLVLKNLLAQIGFSALLLIILVLAMVAASVLAQRRTIGLPLRTFLTAIRNSGPGQTPLTVDWASRDEMGTVIDAYNKLAEDLQSERQRMLDNERRLSRQNESFRTIASIRPADPNNPGDILQMIVRMVPDILSVHRAGIWIFDRQQPDLLVPLVQSADKDRLPSYSLLPLDHAKELLAGLRNGQSITTNDWRNDTRFSPLTPYLSSNNITSLIYAPILTEGELTGLLTIEETDNRHEWGKDEHNYADAIAAAIASLFIGQNRHRAETRAEEKTDMLETAIHAMPGGFCLVDRNMKVAVSNRRLEAMLDLPENSLKAGMPFTRLVKFIGNVSNLFERHQDMTADVAQARLLQGLGERDSVPREFVVNGHRHIEVKASQRPDGGFVLVMNDISNRKTAEKNLILARDKAENATRAKSAFLAAMSHELRTPMNGVIGMLDILKRSQMDNSQQQTVSVIRDSADSLLRILNDILDFSKIEADRMDVELEPFSLRHLVNSVCASTAPSVAGKGLEMLLWIAPDVADQLTGDSTRLRQVLVNLLGNAIKFTEQGYISLRITGADKAGTAIGDRQQRICIQVEDTGIGIEKERLPDLFEAFTQAESSTTRRFGGTGLGLTICRRIVELMGGTITATSVPGTGSRFDVNLSLPLADDDLPAPHNTVLAPSMTRASGKILILSENADRLRSFDYALSYAGYDVDISPVEDAALSKTLSGNDAILLDLDHSKVGDIIKAASKQQIKVVLKAGTNDAEPILYHSPDQGPLAPFLCGSDLAQHVSLILDGAADTKVETSPGDRAPDHILPDHVAAEILFVEDHSTNRLVIQQQLELLGYSIHIAEDGLEALDAIRKQAFKLVLTDCHMPYMDGLALTRCLRAYEQQHDLQPVPIIALTANALQGEREACLQAGMNEFITKPVIVEKLGTVLSAVLNDRPDYVPTPYPGLVVPNGDSSRPYRTVETTDPLERLTPRKAQQNPPSQSDELHDTLPVLDKTRIAALFGNDPDGPGRVYADFMTSNTPLVRDIQNLANKVDREALKLAAHRLKGSAGTCGALQVQAMAYDVEQAASGANKDLLLSLAQQLESGFNRVCATMNERDMAT